MREILFRGKAFNGEWEYGVPVFSGLNNELAFMKQMHSYDHQVIPETVGQYTGLTDKDGKKVFEGDIVHCKYANAPNNKHIQKVVFFEGKFMAEFLNGGCYAELYDGARHFNFDKSVYMTEFEVIGNIHDNPELLKGGAKKEGAEDA